MWPVEGMEGRAIFLDARTGACPDGGGWASSLAGRCLEFGAPVGLRRAESLDAVRGVVEWAEAEAKAGRWVVLALAYEAASAFDSALCVHPPQDGLPLAWAASHEQPLPPPAPALAQAPGTCSHGPWRALVSPQDYAANFARLQTEITAGETYQANYTVPFECAFASGFEDGDRTWFADLALAQAAGFCAWLDLGRQRVLSLSPELFFSVDGLAGSREVLARPMKGTAPRGATAEEDACLRAELAASPKNRAENVMIVDLLRSDLGRVARPGSVRVPRLFQVEEYPTLFQMTSDVRATLNEGVGLPELLAAVFPCGSVTGAPKVRTMQILRELEPHPRGIYCGAIGLLKPGGERMVFSVPIRTLVLDRQTGRARFGVGGGVTHDSDPRAEYAECLTKMRFLTPPGQDFELLESLLLLRGRYPLLAGHLERLKRSAAQFGFALDEAAVRQALAELAQAHPPASSPSGRFKARLLLARDGALRVEAVAIAGGRMPPLRLGFAPKAVDSQDELLQHKTTRRALFDVALAAACSDSGGPGFDDVLLTNERGEVTESTRANLVLKLDGELVTPPLSSGLLPGVFRERLLARGMVREQILFPIDVRRAEKIWLVNSVRWWMDVEVAG